MKTSIKKKKKIAFIQSSPSMKPEAFILYETQKYSMFKSINKEILPIFSIWFVVSCLWSNTSLHVSYFIFQLPVNMILCWVFPEKYDAVKIYWLIACKFGDVSTVIWS